MAPPRARREPRGRWFEDYAVGQVYRSPARTVTEADVVAFACLSGDQNPLHVDAEFARRTPFRQRIAHGLLIQSLASGLAHQMGIFDGTIAALAEVEIRFRRPVVFGDTLRLELGVREVEAEPRPKRGEVRFSTDVLNQDDQVVMEGGWTIVFHRRPTAGPSAAPPTESKPPETPS